MKYGLARRVRLVIEVVASLAFLPSLGIFASGVASAQDIPPSLYSEMKWRMIGPFRAGKVNGVAGVPGNPAIYYMGVDGGGVWKTTDGGVTWKPVFDGESAPSIGALAVAPSNPNVIYVGTGVNTVYGDVTYGNGLYKSADGGTTWQHLGLEDTRHIARILVDPRNPDIVLVAALGHSFAPNEERGVFRSTDGGKSWKKVLLRDKRPKEDPVAVAAKALDEKVGALEGEATPLLEAPKGMSLMAVNDSLTVLMALVDGADFAPSKESFTAFRRVCRGSKEQLGNWEQVENKDVAAFGALLGKNNLAQLPSMAAVAADVSCGN